MKEKELFKNAKFGDKYVTRDGRIAVFYDFSPDKTVCRLLYEGEGLMIIYTGDGSFYHNCKVDNFDIVSRYKEAVDEEKLAKAMDEVTVQVSSFLANTKYRKLNEFEKQIFMTGYRTAKEDI